MVPFEVSANTDTRGKKGLLLSKLQHRDGGRITIINTHLQSQYASRGEKTYSTIRASQIETLTRDEYGAQDYMAASTIWGLPKGSCSVAACGSWPRQREARSRPSPWLREPIHQGLPLKRSTPHVVRATRGGR
jgi:hypothetical protein